MRFERITAGEVREGDAIVFARSHPPMRVTGVSAGPVSVWLTVEDADTGLRAGRIRPRKTARLWLVVDPLERAADVIGVPR